MLLQHFLGVGTMEDSFCETLLIEEAGGIQTCYLRVEKLVSEAGYQVCAEGQKRSRCNGGGLRKALNYQICAARFATLAEAMDFVNGVAQDCLENLGFFRPAVSQ